MSTSSTASQRPPAVASGDGAGRDGFIENQLQRTSLHVKLVDLCSSLMVLAAGVLSFLLIVAVVDHWVLPLGTLGRWVALLVLFAGVACYFVAAVVPLLLGRINPIYAAHAIEQAEPSLKNSLINYLLFRSDRAGVRMGIYQALEQRAASDLSHVNTETIVDRSRMIKIGYVLVAVLVLCAAYTIMAPKSPFQSVARVLVPWADIARPSRVRIEDVQPGNAQVFQGQTLTVSARCYDLRDEEPVTLFYSSLDGQLSRQALTMSPLDAGLVHQCTLPNQSGGFQQDLVYWIQAGDATTPAYQVEVSPAPSILVERIEYEFPPYTRLPSRVVQDRGDIQAIEGTRVTLHTRANQIIAAAVLEFDPSNEGVDAHQSGATASGLSLDTATSHIEMSFAKQEAWCSFNLEMDEARLQPKYQSYHVRFLSEGGHANPHPVLHRLGVVRDLSPEIEILSPAVDRLEIPEDGAQRIEIRAIDPDFGLSQIQLRAVAGGQQVVSKALLEDEAGQVGQSIVNFDFQPRSLGLRAGDAVTYWAIAADNRRSDVANAASPNMAKTREYTFVILPPAQTPPADPGQPEDQPTDDPSMQDQGTSAEKDPPSDDSSAQDNSTGDQGDSPSDGNETGEGDQSQEQGESGCSGDTSEGTGTGEQSGASSGSSADDQQSGGDSSDTGGTASSSNSPSDGSSGDTGGQSSSTGGDSSGNPSGEGSQNGGMSDSVGEASGGAGGSAEPLHDGEVFEKAMDYLRQKDDGRAAGTTDQPPGPDAGASDRPNDGTSQDPSPSDSQDASAGESTQGESSPHDGQPDAAGAGDEQGRPADEPASGAEPSAQGAGKQEADQPGAKGEAGGGQKPEDAAEQGGSPSSGSDNPEGKKKSGSPSGNPGQSGAGDKPEPKSAQGGQQESSSGGASEKKPDGKKKAGSGGSQSQDSSQPKTPSPSQPESSAQGEGDSDRSGGGGSGAGQGANQEGTDTAGSNSPSDAGAGAAEQSGTGETSQDAGDSQQAVDATGQTGQEPGSGSNPKPGGGGSGGVGAQGNSDQNSQTPPVAPATSEGQPNKTGPGVPYGGGMPSTGELKGFDITGEVPPGEKPNVEYARKATDMVLEYLKDQQQDPDQELLDELGWTKDDMNAFVQRWDAMKRSAVEAAAAQRELDEALRSLGLRSDSNSPRSGSARDDTQRAARNLGTRSSPPSAYVEQFNSYRKGTSRTTN